MSSIEKVCGVLCLGKAQEEAIEQERLRYLEFVHAAAIHAVLCAARLYVYAKESAGPLRPGVQTVEGTVKTVVGPVYDKIHGVPFELLKFVDRKVRSTGHALSLSSFAASRSLFFSFVPSTTLP